MLVVPGSFPRMAAMGAACLWSPSPPPSGPNSCLVSDVVFLHPSSSWIIWQRKSCVRCCVATWNSASTSGSSGSEVEDKTSTSSGSENNSYRNVNFSYLNLDRSVSSDSGSVPTNFFGIGSIYSSKFGSSLLQLRLNLIFVAADLSWWDQREGLVL